jgi:hypothetical protein
MRILFSAFVVLAFAACAIKPADRNTASGADAGSPWLNKLVQDLLHISKPSRENRSLRALLLRDGLTLQASLKI